MLARVRGMTPKTDMSEAVAQALWLELSRESCAHRSIDGGSHEPWEQSHHRQGSAARSFLKKSGPIHRSTIPLARDESRTSLLVDGGELCCARVVLGLAATESRRMERHRSMGESFDIRARASIKRLPFSIDWTRP